jgi:predicted kinase
MGPPGSGKSSHAAALEAQGYFRISQDDQGKEHLELFHSHITTGRDIVIDRMNFDKQQRNRYRLEAIKNGYTVNFVEFVVPRQVCYDRCMDRRDHPTINDKSDVYLDMTARINLKRKHTDSALNTYFSRYEEITEDEGEVLRIQYNAPKKKVAIAVDIDGTLANLDHRLHYVKGEGKKDWGSFFRTVGEDGVYEDVAELVRQQSDHCDIILCSGRTEDQTREATIVWLEKYCIPYNKLIMRPAMNYKRDDITKAMLYRYEIKPYYDIKFILDDRQTVVDKWRSMGLSCFQVRPGQF